MRRVVTSFKTSRNAYEVTYDERESKYSLEIVAGEKRERIAEKHTPADMRQYMQEIICDLEAEPNDDGTMGQVELEDVIEILWAVDALEKYREAKSYGANY